MPIDHHKLTTELDTVATFWGYSGQLMVMKDGECIHEAAYGFEDSSHHTVSTLNTQYLLHTESLMFLNLCVLLLIERKKMKLTDTLDLYLPEYVLGNQITIENLMRSQSGIPDYFYGQLMLELSKDPVYLEADLATKRCLEQKLLYENKSFHQVFLLIGEKPLAYEPGIVGLTRSLSNEVFLAEILRRITGLSTFDMLETLIFKPLVMTGIQYGIQTKTESSMVVGRDRLVNVPTDCQLDGVMTVNMASFKPLLTALSNQQLFSKQTWRQVHKFDEQGMGLIFENANGYDCCSVEFLGFGAYVYFNHKTGIAFTSIVNAHQVSKWIDGQWRYVRRALRETLDAAFTYPKHTRMVALNKENLWHALNIKVADEQQDFVLEAKASIAMALMYRTKKAFVQMEGNLVVGLLVLDLDRKKNHFNIDIIQIDQKFQGKGYGKLMLNWAIEYLSKAGAKELEIGVNRLNKPAIKIYMDAGFTPKLIYEGGMTLHMAFQK